MEIKLPVLSTKLLPPKFTKVPERKHLLDLISSNSSKRLVLICAPSGYGKTTLVSDYTKESKDKVLWYRIDKSDADPIVFISYLIEALKKENKDFGKSTKIRLREVESIDKELEQVLLVLVNEIAHRIKKDTTIVLDDYDEISETESIKELLNYLLENSPDNIHFIILSRIIPNLSLAKLRVGREVIIIDTEDLKFSLEEIKKMFETVYPLSLDQEELQDLFVKTEGWIASLLLLYDSIKDMNQKEQKEFILNFMGSSDIYEYLAQEVFEKESEKIKEFLKKTSILSYINEELGILLTKEKNSLSILEYLQKNHVFTARINSSFKYHPLFKQFLFSRAEEEGPSYLISLHKKAASYFRKHDDFNQAIHHCFEAGEYEMAQELIIEIANEMINTSRLQTLSQFIKKLPKNMQDHPYILLSKGKILEIAGRLEEALSLYRQAFYIFKSEKDKEGMGISLTRQGEIYRLESEYDRGIMLLEESLEYIKKKDLPATLSSLASCYLRSNPTKAIELFNQALSLSRKAKDRTTEANILHSLALPHLAKGEFSEALRLMDKSLKVRERLGNRHEMAHTLSFMSLIYRMQGDYERSIKSSEEALSIVEEYGYRRVKGWVLWTRAETYLDIGEIEKALDLVRESIIIFDDLHDKWGLSFALRVLSRAYEYEGQYKRASDFLRQAFKVAESSGGGWEIALCLADLGRLHVKMEDYAEAVLLLLEAKDTAESFESKYILTSINLRLAYLYFKIKDFDKAEENLKKAITISKDNEYHHLLAQEAREALPLLTWAFAQGIDMDYLGRILFRMASEKLYRREEVTVLFADIRGFTNLSEDMAPEKVRSVLNTYLAFLTEIIFKYKGTLDKYIGDAIMAFFSDKEGEADHALRAVEAAILMQKEIRLFQEKGEDLPQVSYGIGVNTGEVVVGHIGSGRRLDFTIVGDSVNVASRLCSQAKQDQTLIGENTYAHIKGKIKSKKIGPLTFKGKSKPIDVYMVEENKSSKKSSRGRKSKTNNKRE